MDKELSANTTLSHYRIGSKIGAGGMGEVYLALDTELDRTVAIKILPEALATDEQRLQRFVQEAKAASALNHPHILTIYEIGTFGDSRFIATEFIDGETLRQRIDAGIKLADILEISIQVGSALAAAHAAGIIHRDIKPENIMVRRDGYIKVLDFGLAKLTGPEGSSHDAEATTRAMINTGAGTVMGTANYMSPEQAKGVGIDARTDLWSLGAVLYEMIAAHVPFAGETPTETLSLILQKEPPPLTRFAHDVPAEMERIVTKALTKDREHRYQTAKDLLIDLRNLRRKLEVDAEIDRTVPPEYRGAAAGKSTSSGQTAPATGSGSAAQTSATSTSSAEYVVSGIKQHKLAIAVAVGLALIAGAVGIFLYQARLAEGAIESIAVMPFVNDSGNADVEYLSDGMTEALINSLSQIPNLSVKARSSVFRYKGKEIDPKRIASELGVQSILTGRVVQRGDQLTLNLELIDPQTENTIWGNKYERESSELVSLQREVARDVSTKLKSKLSGADEARITKSYTVNPEAYQLYLKGRYSWNKRTTESLKQAAVFYNQAIEKDPNYALAYAGLAETYVLFSSYNVASSKDSMPQAKTAAQRALELDDALAQAHTALGMFHNYYDFDLVAAEKEYRRAIELSPNYATAHHWLGIDVLARSSKRSNEALAELRRAEELDPLSLIIGTNLGDALVYARRYDEAIAQYKRVLSLDPNFAYAHMALGSAYGAKGMYPEAIAEMRKNLELDPNPTGKGHLGLLLAKSGKRDEALKLLAQLKQESTQHYVEGYAFVLIYIGLGEKQEALNRLEKDIADRAPNVMSFEVLPELDDLRSDPQFKEMLKRLKLPQ